jgi:hypothetical protein
MKAPNTKTIFQEEWCLAVLMLTSRQELRSVCASISTFQDTGKIMQLRATIFFKGLAATCRSFWYLLYL